MKRLVQTIVLVLTLVTLFAAPMAVATGCSTPGCCKVCKKGKACGDACIEESDTCHAGDGCACNG